MTDLELFTQVGIRKEAEIPPKKVRYTKARVSDSRRGSLSTALIYGSTTR